MDGNRRPAFFGHMQSPGTPFADVSLAKTTLDGPRAEEAEFCRGTKETNAPFLQIIRLRIEEQQN